MEQDLVVWVRELDEVWEDVEDAVGQDKQALPLWEIVCVQCVAQASRMRQARPVLSSLVQNVAHEW